MDETCCKRKESMMRSIVALMLAVTTAFTLPVYAQEDAYHPMLKENMGALVAADGTSVDGPSVLKKKFILLYFAAGWCPHCREFTPQIVSHYNATNGGKNYEVLFISSDKSDKKMLQHMAKTKMPWPALPWNSKETKRVRKSLEAIGADGNGIPRMILLDQNDQVVYNTNNDKKRTKPSVEELQKIDQIVNPVPAAK
jgi:thiol-disulfide isomerase/thioredoxin